MTRPMHFDLSLELTTTNRAAEKLLKHLAEQDRFNYNVRKSLWRDEMDCSVTAIEIQGCYVKNLEELATWMYENINDILVVHDKKTEENLENEI